MEIGLELACSGAGTSPDWGRARRAGRHGPVLRPLWADEGAQRELDSYVAASADAGRQLTEALEQLSFTLRSAQNPYASHQQQPALATAAREVDQRQALKRTEERRAAHALDGMLATIGRWQAS